MNNNINPANGLPYLADGETLPIFAPESWDRERLVSEVCRLLDENNDLGERLDKSNADNRKYADDIAELLSWVDTTADTLNDMANQMANKNYTLPRMALRGVVHQLRKISKDFDIPF